ncbi:MAG: hypothetical protein AAFQ94_23555 [Bacteroidota bacterium]
MKIFNKATLLIFGLSLCMACTDDDTNIEDEIGEAINIKFDVEGEIDLIDESPIGGGRIEGDLGTVFGIQIARKVDNQEVFYREGIFNDLSKAEIELFSDESYVIYFSALQDGTSEGLAYYEDAGDTILSKAFGESRVLDNAYSDFIRANQITEGGFDTYVGPDSVFEGQSSSIIDRFNQKVEIDNPGEADSLITIDLKRASFGLAFRADSIDNNDILKIRFGSLTAIYYQLDSTNNEGFHIITLPTIYPEFVHPDEFEQELTVNIGLDVYDENGDFERERILTIQPITVKRNVKRTYVVNVAGFIDGTNAGKSGFGINFLDDELIDEGEFQINN